MGEYALLRSGERVKIGTTENLMYLRADQLEQLAPADQDRIVSHLDAFLFRFPFPHEDAVEVGAFEADPRGNGVYGEFSDLLANAKHRRLQFRDTYDSGWLAMIPCPLSPAPPPADVTFHRNGFAGELRIVSQRARNRQLVTVVACGGCRTWFRLPTFADAELLLVTLRSRGDRDRHKAAHWHAFAQRVSDGDLYPPDWVRASTAGSQEKP